MPSPFPGMNPYLEQEAVWHDFHQSFIPAARAAISPHLRGQYAIMLKVEEHTSIHQLNAGDFERIGERHSFLEIRDSQGFNLVTMIELLSPSNKSGDDRVTYLNKRQRILNSGVNLVELDLLRGGPRLPIDGLSPCDYYALVVRPEERPLRGIWAFRLTDPLPTIPIPLRAPHADVGLDLKQVLDRVYDGAGYQKFIYLTPPEPTLSAEQKQWANRYLPQEMLNP